MRGFLEGKVAAVTGGTRGIGLHTAAALLREGASVAICGRTQESLDEALAGLLPLGRVGGFLADVSKPEEVAGFFRFVDEEFRGLDVLVNNAGLGVFAAAAALTVEDWRLTLDVNLSGPFYCSREALARFLKTGGGYIINIGSLAGKNPFAGGAAYNASKFGLIGFSEAMMLDHRNDGVRVSCILPGSVNTGFGGAAEADWKIAPGDIADLVIALLRMPERTLVSAIEVRPSQPKKA